MDLNIFTGELFEAESMIARNVFVISELKARQAGIFVHAHPKVDLAPSIRDFGKFVKYVGPTELDFVWLAVLSKYIRPEACMR